MGSNPTPGTLVDPVTGLSRRQAIALAALIPLGIAASTVATVISENVDELCPDRRWECVTIEQGEPVIIGLLAASEASIRWPLREAVIEGIGRRLIGPHPVLVDARVPGCSAEETAEDVRELASDPPDEPPAAVVLGAACELSGTPLAQLLSDTGTTLVSLNDIGPIPTSPEFHLVAPQPDLATGASGLQGIGTASHLSDLIASHLATVLEEVADVVETLAIEDRGRLLIPRTRLRDALVEAGFARA